MPDWMPPLDVRYDHLAAAEASRALAELRFVLAQTWGSEHQAATRALQHWSGAAARAFAVSVRAREAEGGRIDLLLGQLDAAIAAAADDARAAQRRADDLQARWRQELAAETEGAGA